MIITTELQDAGIGPVLDDLQTNQTQQSERFLAFHSPDLPKLANVPDRAKSA